MKIEADNIDDDLLSHYSKRIPVLNPKKDKTGMKIIESDVLSERDTNKIIV